MTVTPLTTHKPEFTPGGMKIEGPYENKRNADNSDLFKAMIRKAYGAGDVIIAHHLTYVSTETDDGYDYQIVEEIPSADTLLFDHDAARKLWGGRWMEVLMKLASTPVPRRDVVAAHLWEFTQKHGSLEGLHISSL